MNKTLSFLLGMVAVTSIANEGCAIAEWSSFDDKKDPPGDASVESSSDSPADAPFICPGCDELLSWDATTADRASYGGISTDSTWDDGYAWMMLDACPGWSIHEGHEGGIGDTLEIASCDGGLVLIWIGDRFSAVEVSKGWTGKTDTSFAIGASYDDFIQAYPGYGGNTSLLDGDGSAYLDYPSGSVYFEEGMLTSLRAY